MRSTRWLCFRESAQEEQVEKANQALDERKLVRRITGNLGGRLSLSSSTPYFVLPPRADPNI